MGCPETSVRNCHYWLRNDSEERTRFSSSSSFHFLPLFCFLVFVESFVFYSGGSRFEYRPGHRLRLSFDFGSDESSETGPRQPPSTSLPIHYSPLILPLGLFVEFTY